MRAGEAIDLAAAAGTGLLGMDGVGALAGVGVGIFTGVGVGAFAGGVGAEEISGESIPMFGNGATGADDFGSSWLGFWGVGVP